MFIKNIDREIVYNTQCNLDVINVSFINETTQNLKNIKVKLSSKYQNFLDVFNRAQIDKLSSHHSYDHKIKLTSDVISLHCQAYWMFFYKLQKVKKYLNENLFKEFITSSKTLYFLSILFILKANKDLWFCIDYWKLNAIIKRNRYSLSLINEMIDKIVDCKHLTWLNIISMFNKL
jgi:predicted DCC family thiol-disulfide oxidoreductase YuxK